MVCCKQESNKMKKNLFIRGGKVVFLPFIFFFLFLLVVSFISAATTIIYFDKGLVIVDSPQIYLQQNQQFKINFFVYNITDGVVIDNSTTNCTFYLADNKGNVKYFTNVSYLSDGYWGLNIIGGNFSEVGEYNYGIKCEGLGLGGISIGSWMITPTGVGNLTQFYWIILVISATILILGFWLKDPWVVIFGTFGLYFVGLYILINGIVGIKDMVTTWAIGLIILAVAAYISIKTAGETIYG